MKTDILIAGSGCSGLYCALKLPRDKKITVITKSDLTSNDSFLAQGGMCMLKEQSDYDSFFEDTMKAGHYENDKKSVEIRIKTSPEVVRDLVSYGAQFERNEDGSLAYTKEGAHSTNRIIFHEDVTGKEITSTLLREVQKLSNVELLEYTTLVDILEKDNHCYGAVIRRPDGKYLITRRVLTKAWAPGWWEVSGGAAQAGESSEKAVRREVLEETGLDVNGCVGGYMFTYHRENPGEGDNYFVDVYRFEKDFKEEDLHLQTEETAGYKIATADEIKALADEGIFLHYDSIKRVFEE